ncbi:MAG: peptidylprolyl isomerase [Gemmatimonadota bacterium]
MDQPIPAGARRPPTRPRRGSHTGGRRRSAGLGLALLGSAPFAVCDAAAQSPRSSADIIASAPDGDWRTLDADNTLYLDLPGGRVILELAPWAASRHVGNIKALVRGGYFDGGAVRRSQDNYVAQWGLRPLAEGETLPSSIASAIPPEFDASADGLSFTPLPDADVYAPQTGFVGGFPTGRDPDSDRVWIAHCYGTVGVARTNDPNSGSGRELYAVTGHAPRHLDRNLSMVGRVVAGMEHLSTLPRGTQALGRYASPEEWAAIDRARIAADLPPGERVPLQVMRTDSPSFRALILAARTRSEAFFVYSPERVDVCNVGVPVREPPPS